MRVSAGSAGPGWGCQCPSQLKPEHLAKATGRASLVQFKYQKTEDDGTLVFKAWTRPEDVYIVTYNPHKWGVRLCKHVIACSAHIVGDWLTSALDEIRKEQDECLIVKKEHQKLQKNLVTAARTMLKTKPVMATHSWTPKKQAPPSDTS